MITLTEQAYTFTVQLMQIPLIECGLTMIKNII